MTTTAIEWQTRPLSLRLRDAVAERARAFDAARAGEHAHTHDPALMRFFLARSALERARDDLGGLAPVDAEAPDMAEIRAAEERLMLAQAAAQRVKLAALLRLLADVRRAHEGRPLPAVWEQIAVWVEGAVRFDQRVDIRFVHDPDADRIHASLASVEHGFPPCILVTLPLPPRT